MADSNAEDTVSTNPGNASTALACWNDAEASASSDASASCYCLSENVLVLTIVVPELKLVQVPLQMLFAAKAINALH